MTSIDSNNFSASDLCLFIESIEKITRMERKKQQRQQQNQASKTRKHMDEQNSMSSSATLSSTDESQHESVLESVDETVIDYDYAGQDFLYNNNSHAEEQNVDYDSTSLEQNEYYEIEDKSQTKKSKGQAGYCKPTDCLESTKLSSSSQSMSSSGTIYEEISPIKTQSVNSISSAIYREPMDRRQITKAPSSATVEYEQIASVKSKTDVTISPNTSEESAGVTKRRSLKKCLLGLVRRNYRKHFSFNTSNWSTSNSWMELPVA